MASFCCIKRSNHDGAAHTMDVEEGGFSFTVRLPIIDSLPSFAKTADQVALPRERGQERKGRCDNCPMTKTVSRVIDGLASLPMWVIMSNP